MQEESQTYSDDKISRLRELLDLVDDSELSSIKSTVSELIRLINDPKSGAKDLKEVIQLDPPLSAKLLKLANSAYYGFPRTIGDIQDAVVCVGFNELKELALNQKISQIFVNESDEFAGYSRALLWKHCVSVAICGKLIYRRAFNDQGGTAYVAGLLHDIGIVIEDQFLLDSFFKILDEFGAGGGAISDIETSVLGYDHTDIGNAIAVDWNFPDETAVAIHFHHTPDILDQEEAVRLTCTLCLADIICNAENLGFVESGEKDPGKYQYCLDKLNSSASTKLNEKNIAELVGEVKKSIARMKQAGWF
ncbi:MAG: HDOD domain-containing protein [Candidatus Glassbacteria bacterium]|nr:HDOD domain-containing protein [Candidatus Glassbacteria bacterium]